MNIGVARARGVLTHIRARDVFSPCSSRGSQAESCLEGATCHAQQATGNECPPSPGSNEMPTSLASEWNGSYAAEILARERWVSLSPIDALTLAVVLLAATPLTAFLHG
ncbi:hypothetical protein [Polyangium sp. 6x1]|uniref:hypothetical protein n=1 Tax=Polyangium sp. 6x1 TaxID=3042689 RepID=UPI002482EEAE|nr:hypothetical protein [Polyangium sp. 6x1]MDI1450355.1 hypothetical protein [Polyangium sp. 6x1]